MKIRFGLVAGIFLAIFALYPQMKLWYVRGAEWQGNYAYNDIDEVAYAAYVKALIDGRPRKNDPYTGRDDSTETPQPESIFSIQFAAPFTLALPARVLGISAPWAMTLGGAVAAFLTALAIFWFLARLSGNDWYAMAGSLVVLAGGALAAGEGAIQEILFDGFSYPYFPGFRRYIPALAMPAFFALVAVVWRLIAGEDSESGEHPRPGIRGLILIVAASILFGYTVFSYFYIWTTALAWFGCLGLCWLIARPEGFRKDVATLIGLGAGCALFLIPYFYLLSKRSHTMDDVQLLVQTNAPDLARFPEYISVGVLIIVAVGILLKKIEFRAKGTLFAISLALVPLVVFNQQIITGRSLQPIHYQVFIGNYVAGLALVAAIGLFLRDSAWTVKRSAKVAFACVAAVAIVWGFVECHYTVRVLDDVNLVRDEQVPLANRLNEFALSDPHPYKTVVLHFGMAEADDLPTLAPQATLWARHQHVFAGVTWQENKERYYQYLYYQGVSEQNLSSSMKSGDFVSMIALFGWGRHTDRLNSDFKPLTFGEIDREASAYGRYIGAFDPHRSPETIVSFVIVPEYSSIDLENLDRWYERDGGEPFGRYTLYRVRLRI